MGWQFQAITIGGNKATNPTPSHTDTEVDFSGLAFSWTGPANFDSFNVYVGTVGVLTLVSTGSADESYTASLSEVPKEQVVYWRVDSVTNEGVVTGDVWNFDPRPGQVTVVNPANETIDIDMDATGVSWTGAGGQVTSYGTYYGIVSGSLSQVSSDAAESATLLSGYYPYYGIKNYWRVDATNSFGTTAGAETWFSTVAIAPPLPTGRTLSWPDSTWPLSLGEGGSGYNFILTVRKLVCAAKDSIFYEDL